MSTKEVLTKAKAIIQERGVNRDGFFINEKSGCEVCALGAVYLAEGGTPRRVPDSEDGEGYWVIDLSPSVGRSYEARNLLEKALPPSAEPNWYVPAFNDSSQTDQEVFDLFDRAIALVSE